MRRVLVTGASGFVCGHIVDGLLAAGDCVVAVDQAFDDDARARWSGQPVEMIESAVEHLPDFAVDAVIHGAAVTAGPEDRGETPEANLRANLLPALDLLEWAGRNSAGRVVVISSSAVFRDSPHDRLTESAPAAPAGLYAVAKRALEDVCSALRARGRDVIAVRLGNLYGPRELRRPTRPRLSLLGALAEQAVTQGRMAVPEISPAVDWSDVRDLGPALVALLRPAALPHGLYHLASGQSFTLIDLARRVQRLVPGSKVDIQRGESLPFRGCLLSERLQPDTGFDRWTDLAAGLPATVAWFQQVLERAS